MSKSYRAQEMKLSETDALDAIFDTSEVLLALLDRDLRFVRVNRAYADAGNMAPEEFIGRRHFDLYPHEENEAIFRGALESGIAHSRRMRAFEYPDELQRGTTYWNWTVRPVGCPSAPQGLLLTLVDVTEQLRAIELADERELLLRELAHRVRNNLQIISSMVRGLGTTSTAEDFDLVQGRILVMARVYEIFDLSPQRTIEVGRCLRRFWDDLTFEADGPTRTLRIVGTLHADLDGAMPIALIVHELLRPCATCVNVRRCNPSVDLSDSPDARTVTVRCSGAAALQGGGQLPDLCLVNGLASQMGAEVVPLAQAAPAWKITIASANR